MTDRHMGYIVMLDENIREDDSQHVITALRMIKGVIKVAPVLADYEADVIAVGRRDRQWQRALNDLQLEGPGAPVARDGEGRLPRS